MLKIQYNFIEILNTSYFYIQSFINIVLEIKKPLAEKKLDPLVPYASKVCRSKFLNAPLLEALVERESSGCILGQFRTVIKSEWIRISASSLRNPLQ